jgi:hypothetical protein
MLLLASVEAMHNESSASLWLVPLIERLPAAIKTAKIVSTSEAIGDTVRW